MSNIPQTPNPPPAPRASRVLAALDNPTLLSTPPVRPAAPGQSLIDFARQQFPAVISKRELELDGASGSDESRKRRRLRDNLAELRSRQSSGAWSAANLIEMHRLLSEVHITGPRRDCVNLADVRLMSQVPSSQPRAGGSKSQLGQVPSATGTFSLRYDTESNVRAIDRGGTDQNAIIAEFVSDAINNASHGVTIRGSMEHLGLRSKRDLLPGMEVRLLPHQIIGVSWMVNQERNSPHKGGILADEMGLGKTVQMIATMAMNLPDGADSCRTTLIVVPAALLLQWKEEIENKTNGMFNVHIHHGRDKLKSAKDLSDIDVVITTYQTLNQDFPMDDVDDLKELQMLLDQRCVRAAGYVPRSFSDPTIFAKSGVLARHKWYRVVLDEAQFIRNRATRSSVAVAMLRSKYRWCLTGTPITNTLADIYGFLRFGHFRPWNDWDSFNAHIARVQLDDAPLAGLRAQEILKPIMMRRTKDAELEGEPLLQLPEKNVELVTLDFSDEERELYDNFEKRARIQLNRYIKNNTIVKNHTAVLVLILRLRQLCCHPNLILSLAEGFEDPTMLVGSEADKEVARATRLLGPKWVTGVKQRFMERAKASELDFDDESDNPEPTCPVCGDLFMNNSGRLLGCGHEICFDCLEVLSASPIEHNGEFGNADEQTNIRIEKEFETAAAKGLRPCPTCKKMMDLRPSNVFCASAFEPSPDDVRSAVRKIANGRRRITPSNALRAGRVHPQKVSPSQKEIEEMIDLSSSEDEDLPDVSQLLSGSPSSKRKGKSKASSPVGSDVDDDMDVDLTMDEIRAKRKGLQKGKGREKALLQNQDDSEQPREMSDQLIQTWRRGDNNLEPSTKMLALVQQLQEWDATGDKTIVFSQWTTMLDLLETLFARYGIRSLRFDGKMNREARELVLAQFRKAGGIRIILIRHVLCTCAFTLRAEQMRTCSTKCGGVGLNLVSANRVINMDLAWNFAAESQAYDRRLVVRNTIEERMLRLQETKVGLAEAALGEGTGIKLHKLSVRELRDLFGMNKLTQGGHGQNRDPNQARITDTESHPD
ncbi:uncharacterized protein FIBRA_01847 [Fibroporia radiculosa]|uniref:Helicase ATP-binding domain-containing protein n=1 Tax=Fibroporia radiculosa TaxID=599839 RepID=J4G177_9APHY|nr:uncharacterized protein FIBRA_01847 [Fibroporia radiculosa]CCL99823.1 predicted protein [Fibroporia radiculosa]